MELHRRELLAAGGRTTSAHEHRQPSIGARGPRVARSGGIRLDLKEKLKLPGTTLVGPTGGPRSAFTPGTQIAVLMIPILAKTLDPH